jgi:dihydroorotate dehydrogenase (NAD+) catalytic subunit
MAEKLSYSDVDAVELNVSCPNVKEGGAAFGNTPEGVKRITSLVRESCRKPLLVKLTPAVSDIRAISKAAQESGADAITLINTLLGMAIDINTKRPILRNNFGGLSGPAIKPIALRMTYEAASSVKIPIIGMGGISKAEDAIEFILAGASAVMIGTWNFVNPRICEEVSEGIKTYLIKNNYSSINDLIGGVILYD